MLLKVWLVVGTIAQVLTPSKLSKDLVQLICSTFSM